MRELSHEVKPPTDGRRESVSVCSCGFTAYILAVQRVGWFNTRDSHIHMAREVRTICAMALREKIAGAKDLLFWVMTALLSVYRLHTN